MNYPNVMKPSGPTNAKIMLVGEAPGKDEVMLGVPFVGSSGRELDRMLAQAGIDTKACYKTNVFWCQPPKNDLLAFTGSKSEAIPGLPAVKPGKYIRLEFKSHYDRLYEEIRAVKPNIIIPLGNTALAALTGHGQIGRYRGTVVQTKAGVKALATFHPASVLRVWSQRPICVADFIKAKRESEFPEIVIPPRKILINPSLHELETFYDFHLAKAKWIAVDIETKSRQIRCIGFAPTPTDAVVIPFADTRQAGNHYWLSLAEETRALTIVRKVLEGPALKVLQNGSYDLQYIWRWFKCGINNWAADTTIAHHALYPEMQKDLGFLGSLYTIEPAWKIMRHRSGDDVKKEE